MHFLQKQSDYFSNDPRTVLHYVRVYAHLLSGGTPSPTYLAFWFTLKANSYFARTRVPAPARARNVLPAPARGRSMNPP